MNIRYRSSEAQRATEQQERNLWRMVAWRQKYFAKYGRLPSYRLNHEANKRSA